MIAWTKSKRFDEHYFYSLNSEDLSLLRKVYFGNKTGLYSRYKGVKSPQFRLFGVHSDFKFEGYPLNPLYPHCQIAT